MIAKVKSGHSRDKHLDGLLLPGPKRRLKEAATTRSVAIPAIMENGGHNSDIVVGTVAAVDGPLVGHPTSFTLS